VEMARVLALIAVLLACLSAGEAGGSAEKPALPDPVPNAEQAGEIARLTGELGSEKFEVRDAAFKRLRDIGRPALSALRGAAAGKDLEVATSAALLIHDIENNIRANLRIKVRQPDASGEREVIIEAPDSTVTVLESAREFTVVIRRGKGAAEVSSTPNRGEFQKKFPDLWKSQAEPALAAAADPDKLIIDQMARQLLPQLLAKFAKESGRAPTAEEITAAEKTLRAELQKSLEANRAKKVGQNKTANEASAAAP